MGSVVPWALDPSGPGQAYRLPRSETRKCEQLSGRTVDERDEWNGGTNPPVIFPQRGGQWPMNIDDTLMMIY